uniref:uncharacterized protein LOC122583387 n=1 Tax=Erigeron canadensis TaxID=72917 RepID=UPI001CB8D2BF|nr:uncharacterized protein LOC122583387 [Erigeron canadensis]
MKGCRFTFCKEDRGKFKLSKIYRVLVGNEVMDKWPNATLRALPRGLSDRNPLLLKIKNVNYGPKPFRFFNSWLDKGELEEVVHKAVESFVYNGPADLKLILKLKHTKKHVKQWREESKVKDEEEMAKSKKELEEIDLLLKEREISDEECWIRTKCLKNIIKLEEAKAKDLKQRVKWAIDGDENSRFFHGFINKRRTVNCIQWVQINGIWEDRPKFVKKHIHNYFKNKFHEDWASRPQLSNWTGATLNRDEAAGFILEFSPGEIKRAIFECGNDKALGLDGSNSILDLSSSFGIFWKTILLIYLMSFMFQVISKVLSNRLKKVLASVISSNQAFFLGERNIIDGPLILNEVLAWAKKKNKKLFAFKFDFEKAYDNFN